MYNECEYVICGGSDLEFWNDNFFFTLHTWFRLWNPNKCWML